MAGTILIADEQAKNRIAYRAMLQSARYETLVAADREDLLGVAREEQPDLILMDAGLGIGALAALQADRNLKPIPVIVLAGNDTALRISLLEAGAEEVTTRPVAGTRLLARIRSVLRARDTSAALAERQATVRQMGFAEGPAAAFAGPTRIALVTPDPARAGTWAERLKPHLRSQLCPLGLDSGLAEADRRLAADVFVIEAGKDFPMAALRLLSELRSRPSTRHAGIIVVHDPADADTAAIALDLGASDLCESGFDPAELALRLKIQLRRKGEADRLRATVDEGLRLAMVDPLTGLFNRRYALAHAERLLSPEAALRGFAVVLGDIDRFKLVNDTYGHAAGDAVLTAVAHRLRDNVRGMDMVARFGGEEFMLILPETDRAQALAAAARLCALVRDEPVVLASNRGVLPVTISFGVAMAAPEDTVETVIERADEALYAAKAAGRDRVRLSGAEAAA